MNNYLSSRSTSLTTLRQHSPIGAHFLKLNFRVESHLEVQFGACWIQQTHYISQEQYRASHSWIHVIESEVCFIREETFHVSSCSMISSGTFIAIQALSFLDDKIIEIQNVHQHLD